MDRATGNVYVISLYSRVEGDPVVATIQVDRTGQQSPAPPVAPLAATRLPVLAVATWGCDYPQRAANGRVDYIAQWSDGTYSAAP